MTSFFFWRTKMENVISLDPQVFLDYPGLLDATKASDVEIDSALEYIRDFFKKESTADMQIVSATLAEPDEIINPEQYFTSINGLKDVTFGNIRVELGQILNDDGSGEEKAAILDTCQNVFIVI